MYIHRKGTINANRMNNISRFLKLYLAICFIFFIFATDFK